MKLKPETFTIYCTSQEKVIATRVQIPICLGFSVTIHKAQGLTLGRIEVDGDNIFNPGQLGVAIGRTTQKKSLRIINFTPSSVLKHDESIYNFCDNAVCADFSENLKCCRTDISIEVDLECPEKVRNIHNDDDDMSDFTLEEITQIDTLFTESHEAEIEPYIFENKLKQELTEIFNRIHSFDSGSEASKTNSKNRTSFYSEVYKFSISERYKKTC